MKQIEEMFERFIEAKKPLKKKWQIRTLRMKKTTSYDDSQEEIRVVIIKHYHHTIFLFDIDNAKLIYQMQPETGADRRGVEAISNYLLSSDRKQKFIDAARNEDPVFKMQYDLDFIQLQNTL